MYYYKSSNPLEGIKVKKIDKKECTYCEYLLDDLDNNDNYSIILIAFNKNGRSPPSEKIEAKPMYNINLIYSEQ